MTTKQQRMKGSCPHPGPRYVALVRVLRATEGLWEASRVFFDRWELSPSQFNLLILLYERSAGCTQIELSRELIMHRSNVTGLVDRLEARGWVKRQDVHTDRRAYHIVLTPAGHRLLLQILPSYYEAVERLWADMPRVGADRLAAQLESMVAQAQRVLHPPANKTGTPKGNP
jgi:MarR family 2-MHQ and catechol resistance regulon transcriptional repressor